MVAQSVDFKVCASHDERAAETGRFVVATNAKSTVSPVRNPAILDTATYGAVRPWADGNVLMQGRTGVPSAFLIVAPTRLSQGPLRTKGFFFFLRSMPHHGKTKTHFFSAWLPLTASRIGHSAKSLILRKWPFPLSRCFLVDRSRVEMESPYNPRCNQFKSRRAPHDLF